MLLNLTLFFDNTIAKLSFIKVQLSSTKFNKVQQSSAILLNLTLFFDNTIAKLSFKFAKVQPSSTDLEAQGAQPRNEMMKVRCWIERT